MERVLCGDAKEGEARVCGWVDGVRNLKNIAFIIVRDKSGKMQLTIPKREAKKSVLEALGKIGLEDCVCAEGSVVSSSIAKMGKEMLVKNIEIVSKAEKPLPIDFSGNVRTEKDKRLDHRYLDLRNEGVRDIFLIKACVCSLIRDYFKKEGFTEVHTPVIQSAGAEGGSTLFPIDYYKRRAFLRQSPQLYKQVLMASGLERVYEIGQAFRAEKFHTPRHVSEFISVDAEQAWISSEEDVMATLEKMVVHVLRGVKREFKEKLESMGVKIRVPELPFPRISYTRAVEILRGAGVEIEWGSDFGDADEKKLGEELKRRGVEWYFITKYPSKIKPFYIMFDGEISRGMDLDYLGMEIASGGQREHRYSVLVNVMKGKGLDPRNFEFYLNAFKYGMPPHGGFGFGLERFVEKLLGLSDIKEAILFPRTPERVVP